MKKVDSNIVMNVDQGVLKFVLQDPIESGKKSKMRNVLEKGVANADMQRMEKFFDVFKYFLKNASSIDEALLECQKTQEYLGELIKLKFEYGNEAKIAKGIMEKKIQYYSDIIYDNLKKRGIKPTESVVSNKVTRIYGEEIEPLRRDYEEKQLCYEMASDAYMAMMQRKSILVEFINHIKSRQEVDTCLLHQKAFLEKFMRGL
jgi:hypothetical protein